MKNHLRVLDTCASCTYCVSGNRIFSEDLTWHCNLDGTFDNKFLDYPDYYYNEPQADKQYKWYKEHKVDMNMVCDNYEKKCYNP